MKISMINEIDETIILSCHSFHSLVFSNADLILFIKEVLMYKLLAGPILTFHHLFRKDIDADVGDDSIEEEGFANSDCCKHEFRGQHAY